MAELRAGLCSTGGDINHPRIYKPPSLAVMGWEGWNINQPDSVLFYSLSFSLSLSFSPSLCLSLYIFLSLTPTLFFPLTNSDLSLAGGDICFSGDLRRQRLFFSSSFNTAGSALDTWHWGHTVALPPTPTWVTASRTTRKHTQNYKAGKAHEEAQGQTQFQLSGCLVYETEFLYKKKKVAAGKSSGLREEENGNWFYRAVMEMLFSEYFIYSFGIL